MRTSDRQEPVFVVFEGLDGSGKSTCAKLVADLLGAEFLTTPSPEVRVYRDDLIERFDGCQEACKFFFYLATVFSASQAARALLREGRAVVDRSVLPLDAGGRPTRPSAAHVSASTTWSRCCSPRA